MRTSNLQSCLDKQFRLPTSLTATVRKHQLLSFREAANDEPPLLDGFPHTLSKFSIRGELPFSGDMLSLPTFLLREPVADSSVCHTNNMADDE